MSNTITSDDDLRGQDPDQAGVDRTSSTLYKIFWRWHFYAGLFAIPILVLLCLSGIIYLFRPQLDALQYNDIKKVAEGNSVVSYQQQVEAVLADYPGATSYELGTPPTPTDATQVAINTADGKDLTVYVNPYTGEVTGAKNNGTDISNLALELHGTLLFGRVSWLADPDEPGKWGDRIIELAASWTVVLVITGTYLFWPRKRRDGSRNWRQALSIRRGVANKRLVWRDVHAVTGVLFSFILLFFLITGLMWAGVWGAKYGEITTKAGISYPEGIWDGAASQTGDDLQRTAKGGWLANNLPLFPSGDVPEGQLEWDPTVGAPIDAIVSAAQEAGVPSGVPFSFPTDKTGSYTVSVSADGSPFVKRGAQDARTMYIDQYTAEVLKDFEFEKFGLGAQVSDIGITLHEGRQFGNWNVALTFITTLAILISLATSIMMWIKRRPKAGAGLAAPKRTAFDSKKQAGMVVAIFVALGVFFPLLGYSMVALLAVDFLVVRRVPALRRFFG
jgi:uncharacterized iron-regulated membrane protein